MNVQKLGYLVKCYLLPWLLEIRVQGAKVVGKKLSDVAVTLN